MTNQRAKQSTSINTGRVLIYTVLILGAVISIIPFLYMILTSLKTYGSVVVDNFWPWPPFGTEAIQWSNYPEAIKTIGFDKQWQIPLFYRYLMNSMIVSGVIILGTAVTSILAAYVFAYLDIPGKNFFFMLVLATLMIPNDLTLVSKVVMVYNFKWYNTYQALTAPFLVSVFGIFLLRQFFMQIPRDLYDAARIDGAGHLRYLAAIVVPISQPAVITIALLNFIWSLDNFRWPLLVTRDESMRVLAVGLQQFWAGEGATQTHLLMAFASMIVVPILVFYFFTQKNFTEGISKTGIKG
jgi:ABC-type glycerol-3-phosphate transport system permease component